MVKIQTMLSFLLVLSLMVPPRSDGFTISPLPLSLKPDPAASRKSASPPLNAILPVFRPSLARGDGQLRFRESSALRLTIGDGSDPGENVTATMESKEKSSWKAFDLSFVAKSEKELQKDENAPAEDSRPPTANSSKTQDSKAEREGEAWKGFSFPPLAKEETFAAASEKETRPAAKAREGSSNQGKDAAGKDSDGEWKGFSFPKFEGAGEEQYDIIEVLKAPAKQASESFPFPFGDAAARSKVSSTPSASGGDGTEGKKKGDEGGGAGKEDGSDPEQAMKDLLKQMDKARMDLADAAMRLSNFEQDMARVREAGEGGNRTGPTVTLSREGTDTVIRIDTMALGEGTKRKKMISMLNSALASIPFPSSSKAKPDKEGADVEGSASSTPAPPPSMSTRSTAEEKQAAREAEAEDALVNDIIRKAKLAVDAEEEAARKAKLAAVEKKRISRTRTLKGVSKVVRAWYGNPRDIMKLYNATTQQRNDPQLTDDKPGSAALAQEWNFWEALWKTDGDGIPGKEVTESVSECLRIVPEESGDGAVPVGQLSLKDSLNDIFGDPAFGVNKVLVVEFLDGDGNNMTAAWMETDSRPRMWKNEMPQIVVSEIAGGVLDSIRLQQMRREEGLLDDIGESGGNSWIKKMLWLPDDQLRDEVWVEEEAEEEGEEVLLADRPPPAVIPFIKYASPGPPRSPWTEPDCNLPEFRVLSLDGGGVRGVLTAVILGRIVEAVPSFLDNVDLIAGTSTGGLIALMLAAGYTPRECQAIYEYGCPLIFAKDPWRVYNPLKAKFSPKGREDLCRTYLGEDRTLGDLQKHVVVTAFKLDGKVGPMGTFISNNGGWRPSVFSNIPKMDGVIEPELDMYCWDAALRTSAAPTYFPAHRGYVDGAMFANNPSMLAVTKACAHFPRVSPDNMVVMSLGAGNFPISIDVENQDMDWGIKDWVPFIFDLMMDGDSLSGELLLRYMLNSPQGDFTPEHRYHRIDPTLSQYVELDDVDVIPELIRLGQSVDLTDAIAFAQRHFSNTPSASDAFAQAAVRTATWAKEQATKVQLRDVIESLAVMPSNGIPSVGTWPVWTPGSTTDPSAPEGMYSGEKWEGEKGGAATEHGDRSR